MRKNEIIRLIQSRSKLYTPYSVRNKKGEFTDVVDVESVVKLINELTKTTRSNLNHFLTFVEKKGGSSFIDKDKLVKSYLRHLENTRQAPVQIEVGEWLYKGCFIQEQIHPELLKYQVFKNDKKQTHVGVCSTFAQAKKLCEANECTDNYAIF